MWSLSLDNEEPGTHQGVLRHGKQWPLFTLYPCKTINEKDLHLPMYNDRCSLCNISLSDVIRPPGIDEYNVNATWVHTCKIANTIGWNIIRNRRIFHFSYRQQTCHNKIMCRPEVASFNQPFYYHCDITSLKIWWRLLWVNLIRPKHIQPVRLSLTTKSEHHVSHRRFMGIFSL